METTTENTQSTTRVVETEITTDELKPTPQTIARTIIYFLTWINMLFAFFGMPQLIIDPDMLATVLEGAYVIISAVAAFGSSLLAWWKNNSFTKAAIAGDHVMRDLKEEDE